MANEDLKLYAAAKGVKLWQVAERFGLLDSNFSRLLRKEFTAEQAAKFKNYVDNIAEIKKGDDIYRTVKK